MSIKVRLHVKYIIMMVLLFIWIYQIFKGAETIDKIHTILVLLYVEYGFEKLDSQYEQLEKK